MRKLLIRLVRFTSLLLLLLSLLATSIQAKSPAADSVRLDSLRSDVSLSATSPPVSVVIRSVVLAGNLRTRDQIILREMALHTGDTIRSADLPGKLAWDQRKISNTNLFVVVSVDVNPGLTTNGSLTASPDSVARSPLPVDVIVTMKERWYIFPVLIFDIADRNFNEWWYDRGRDLRRTVYGARLDYKNISGRNDKLTAVFQLGFTRRLSFAYSRPYIDRAQRTGMRFDISETTNREVAYRSRFDKSVYGKGEGEVRERFTTGLNITRRDGFYTFHGVELRYNRNWVADSIARLNPDYFLDGRNQQRYVQLSYGFTYDRRDNVAYPLQGVLVNASITQNGLLPGDDLHVTELAAGLTRFWPLGGKFYANNSLRGRMAMPTRIPYHNLRGLGYGQDLVRGYELYVIDGQRYGLFKNSIKYQLFNTVKQLRWLHVRQFNTLPVAAYLTAFGDAGYVSSTVSEQYGSLRANRWLVGGGLSLDLALSYNLVMRFSGSLNREGQRGFFFNLTQGL